MNAFLATLLDPDASEFHVTHIEMIKVRAGRCLLARARARALCLCPTPPLARTPCVTQGIAGQGFYSVHAVPIIENTARECELTDRLREAMQSYPEANAVLVRRHGVYVWGKDWIQAKTQFECYEYLFEAAVRMRQLGLDAGRAPAPPLLQANGHAAHASE